MLKKLFVVSFVVLGLGCLSLYAQIREKKPALPKDIARFGNEYPMDLFKVPAVKTRLRTLLGKSYNSFMEAIDTQEPMEKNGNFLIGSGCARGICTIYEAVIVIDLSAKTIHCGIVNTSAKTKYRSFSEAPNDKPAILENWANQLLKEEN
jgi:hypothetical protein